ncbi:MAG: NAD-dependent epimerase/dehydratase family protein [Clostridiales bacterium]|jgi:CDP-paratose 2-epimerase|nr:NAD-dependent epimerase/dehydratase family protein [Clostridiales bacterium]
MKILLTGASGFIGKHFYRKFRKTHEIIAPTHEELDVTDMGAVIRYIKGVDAVVHMANAHGDNTANNNILMFKNLQSACSMYKIPKLIVIGSGYEFDYTQAVVSAKETDVGKTMPKTDYGYSKNMITQLARADKFTTVLRFFDVFGKKSPNNFLMDIIKRGAEGKELVLDKNKLFSATFVVDAVKLIERFCVNDYPKGEYNCVPSKPYDKYQVLRILYALSEKTLYVGMKDPKSFETEYTADNAKLMKALGEYKFTSPRSAIKKVYVKERAAHLKRTEKERVRTVKKERRLAAAREKRRLAREAARAAKAAAV